VDNPHLVHFVPNEGNLQLLQNLFAISVKNDDLIFEAFRISLVEPPFEPIGNNT
jgi:hypothetical protein